MTLMMNKQEVAGLARHLAGLGRHVVPIIVAVWGRADHRAHCPRNGRSAASVVVFGRCASALLRLGDPAHFAQRNDFDLADTLAGEPHLLADFAQGVAAPYTDTESQLDDALLPG